MTIRYVEAMIQPVDTARADRISTRDAERAMVAVTEKHTSEEVNALNEALDDLFEAIYDHERDYDDGAPLIPVSHPDTIARQLETSLFLPGEEVAILRLSDLKALIANQSEEIKVPREEVERIAAEVAS